MTRHDSRVGRDITAEQRRLQIMRAALRCLSIGGYDTIRLRDIATEAGISTGVLQHHFESRENLLTQALSFVSDQMVSSWADIVRESESPWHSIVGLIERLFRLPDVEAHCRVFVEFAAVSTRHDLPRERFEAVYTAWRCYLEEAIQLGIDQASFIPIMPKGDIATILMAVLDGSEVAIATNLSDRRVDEMRELIIVLCRRLLGYNGDQVRGTRA